MGTTIANVIEDANALMEHIKYYLDIKGRSNAHTQRLVQLADELIEQLCIEQEEAEK
jgi:hypothetical protein